MNPAVPGDDRQGRGRSKTFRKSKIVSRLTAEQSRRQSDVLRHAWRRFGQPGPVMAFLNAQNDQLNGQPLQLAVESDEGLMQVERLLAEMTLMA